MHAHTYAWRFMFHNFCKDPAASYLGGLASCFPAFLNRFPAMTPKTMVLRGLICGAHILADSALGWGRDGVGVGVNGAGASQLSSVT